MAFQGETALVTGAGRNIGKGIALAMAEAGINVAVNVRSTAAEADEVVSEAREFGVKAIAVVGDVADPHEDERIINETVHALGSVNYLIDCVAPRPRQSLLDISVTAWDDVIRGTLSSTFYLSRLTLPAMVNRRFGRVIAIGGALATFTRPGLAHVASGKHGLLGLIKSIALEFGRFGITANVVSPGWTDTSRDPQEYPRWPPPQERLDEVPVPRLGRIKEIAAACMYLASDEASYTTGQHLHVNGGMVMC